MVKDEIFSLVRLREAARREALALKRRRDSNVCPIMEPFEIETGAGTLPCYAEYPEALGMCPACKEYVRINDEWKLVVKCRKSLDRKLQRLLKAHEDKQTNAKKAC